jgi:hypothetical protein
MHFALRESMMAALGFYILFSWSSSPSHRLPPAPFSSPDATIFFSQEEPRSSCTLHDREHGCSKLSPLRLHQRLPSSPNLLPSPNCKTVHRLDQPTIPIPNRFCVSSGRCSSPPPVIPGRQLWAPVLLRRFLLCFSMHHSHLWGLHQSLMAPPSRRGVCHVSRLGTRCLVRKP